MPGLKGRYTKMNEDYEKDLHSGADFESGQTTGSTDSRDVVDSTAEVVNEEPADTGAAQSANSYSYENYGRNNSSQGGYDSYRQSTYQSSGSDRTAGSTSGGTSSSGGNGYYQYGSSDHDYYKSENYGSSTSGGGNGGDGGRGGRKGGNGGNGHGKAVLAIVLAVVFAVCAVAGVWGVRHYLGSGTTASATNSITDSAQNSGSAVTGQQNDTDSDSDDSDDSSDAAQDSDSSAGDSTSDDSEMTDEDVQAVADEAGLIISDSTSADTDITKAVDKVMPSIVSVYNNYTQEVQSFYGQTYTQEGESTGSGIIIGKTDDELLIVTNNHVVEDADELRVQFIDEESYEAEIKGTDSSNDLAVIAVQLDDMKDSTLNSISVATLGNSDNLKIGEQAIAIGNALGYGQSVTTGIVSATDREISNDEVSGTFIQTDAAINPGNSGGALVNINGEVIGINSSKIADDTVEGMGFAIPITRAIPIIEELMTQDTKTKVAEDEQGTIGISGVSVTSSVANAYNMPQGVYVAEIIEGSGAADSDLQQGDIITAINGTSISSMEELQKQLQYYAAGTTVTLTVERAEGNGSYSEQSIDVTLGTQESIQSAQNTQDSQNSGNSENSDNSGQNSEGSQQDSDQSYGSGYFPFGF